MRLKTSLCLFILLNLTACGLIKPVSLQPIKRYTLQVRHLAIKPYAKTNNTILILATQAAAPVATDRMVYIKKPYEQSYYAKHRWAKPPAKFIAPQLIKALQLSQHFKAVVAAPIVGITDYRLTTRLLTLEQSFLSHPSQVKMQLQVELVRSASGKVIAAKTFTATVRSRHDNAYGGVMAANQALAMILKRVNAFVVRYT
ncbi:MAG: ABC-type transport auxiliary lipoprotein family protein [Pseudomonadota bacterium]